MLIIFDLDDTLIDTSFSITPVKLQDAFHRMQAAGMQFPEEGRGIEILQRLNSTALSAKDALEEFFEIHQLEKRFLSIGLEEIYEGYSDEIPVFPVKGAIEVLDELCHYHEMAIVTVGKEGLQKKKMKKAGIDFSYFSRIIVTETKNKKPHYQQILEESGLLPTDILVCGDRIQTDLLPARELGFHTVQFLFGRGKYCNGQKSDVDYSIVELSQLKQIIMSLTESRKKKPW